jgi:hypothetical protein
LRELENKELRRIFGPKREEITRGWRKSHNVERCNLYFSPNVTTVVKSKRIRQMGHVAGMRQS